MSNESNIKLIKNSSKPNQDLIKALESCLEEAKNGSLTTFIGSGQCSDKTSWITYVVNEDCNIMQMIGCLQINILDLYSESNLVKKDKK